MTRILNHGLLRFITALFIALVFGWLVSEVSFRITDPGNPTEPQMIEWVIPAGTAQNLADNQEGLSLPDQLVFYEGDTLVVRNEDLVSHQLGPIWVPPGQTGKMTMNTANRYRLDCSFTTEKKLGLDVRGRVTTWVRTQAILAIGLPSGVLLWLFSLAAIPFRPTLEKV